MSKDYKDTLNLPNTDFPMKANLVEREPEMLQYWEAMGLYEQLKNKGSKKPTFILADGPPYANGPIHLGHAVNKILKDIVVKSKTLSGFYAPYIPGWDCHGLPIELNVEKQVGKPGIKVDPKTFRQKCREYARQQVDIQREAFIRLGVFGDWENPYLTMDYTYEANIIRSLAKIAQNGHLQKGYKPVHWCVDCGSALAEAEVEYQDKISSSVDVGFLIEPESSIQFPMPLRDKSLPIWLGVWTTTPWTLPANAAVAVNPEFSYSLILHKKQQAYYCVASALVLSFAKRTALEDYEIVGEFKGALLKGMLLQHPFYDKKVPVVLGNHVTEDSGTGFVHTAPAHGQDDYAIGIQNQLPIESLVGSNGCYVTGTPLFAGESVFKVNDKIIELLKAKGCLIHESKIEHSYPHCWRHKSPLIFRATQQWFISMDQNGLRANALQAIREVNWIPGWGQARIEGMIAERPDWCVSRQRTWCVPMGLILHRETGDCHPRTPELMEAVAKCVEQEGIEAWYELSLDQLLGSEAKDYEKSQDTLDVWFDSGVYHYCLLGKHADLKFPADLYLEGSDQHRGWFQSSLLTSVAMNNQAPFKQVLTHGFTVDVNGHKMSKSLGNVVAPEKVISSVGADVLRLWVAATDYRTEMVVSNDILKQASDIYRRIRNTARFLLANLNGFDPKEHLVSPESMLALDRFIVERARSVQDEVVEAYEDFQFHLVYQKVHHYCAVDLGSFYLDVIKDRQYTGKSDGLPRRSAQTALYYIAESLVRWIAPILSFTAEEIWKNLPGSREASVFLSEWYNGLPNFQSNFKQMDPEFWEHMLMIRNAVNKAIEAVRASGLLGSGLEAEVDLYCDPKSYAELSKLKDELRFLLITSRADLHPESKRPETAKATEMPGLWITVEPSIHAKCDRCWHRCLDVNTNPDYPNICSRCIDNIAAVGEVRLYV